MEANRKETLKKLRTLAERGVNVGEREAASTLLLKLCNKYGISIDDVEGEDEKRLVWFVHKQGEIYKKLLNQVMYKVCGTRPIYKRGKERILGTYCTAAEAVEIEMDYSFYLAGLKDDIKRLYKVFVQKNKLFPPETVEKKEEASEASEWTDEDMALYEALGRRTRTKQIENR